MVKRCFSVLLFFVATAAALSQAQAGQDLYPAVSNSVVFLEHLVFIKASDSTRPELWRRYEKATERKILDADVEAMSGSGFFIDGDGYILTNRHVAKVDGADDVRRMIVNGIGNKLDNDLQNSFTSLEREAMKKDLGAMASKAAYSFVAFSGPQRLGTVDTLVIAPDKDPDLALLRVQGSAYPALRLAPSSVIGRELAGTDVYSFGYPLGGTLDAMFKDRAVTMNRGAVSAVRTNADYKTQHSAAISHGNSGGPLVDSQGQVVGVNTASLQEQSGNSLFYAVDAAKIHEFMNASGYSLIDLWNRRIPDPIAVGANVPLNALGEIEVSSSVILNVPKDAEIFVDGKSIGRGTMVYGPTSALSELELKGSGGSFKAKLRLINNLPGTTSLKLGLPRTLVPVKLESEPAGATVVVDGKVLGTTPFSVSLMPDSYAIQLRKTGFWYPDEKVSAVPDSPCSVMVKGEQGFAVNIKGLPNAPGVTTRFESVKGVSSFRPDETPRLSNGDWTLTVDGLASMKGVTRSIAVANGEVSFDLSAVQKTGKLKIIGFDKGATLWIDGKLFPVSDPLAILVPIGSHSVYAWKGGVEPYSNPNVNVGEDGLAFVRWEKTTGHDVKRNLLTASAVGVGALGAGILIIGIINSVQDKDYINESHDYSGYTLNSMDGLTIVVGSLGVLTGGGLELAAINEDGKYKKQAAYKKTLEQPVK